MTTDELRRVADELGLDVVGAAPAAPYDETEHYIRDRRERGLFGSMRFTMAQPEVSCHPETLLEGARTVVSAALCYYVPEPRRRAGEGRLPRYAWRDHYALLRERLDALGRRLGGAYRVLVDANQHVDRAGAERSGVGFIGKNTLLITRKHGSWVVLPKNDPRWLRRNALVALGNVGEAADAELAQRFVDEPDPAVRGAAARAAARIAERA